MFYLYMVQNSDGALYVGVTEDPEKRLRTHNLKQGAQFTKNKSSFSIVFLENYGTLVQARTREIQIKKWSRKKKEMLIKLYAQGLPTKQ